MSDDLIKFEPESQLPDHLRDQFEKESKANLEGVTPRLPKIQLPTGQSKEYTIEIFGEEAKQEKTFTGVILYQTASNAYWTEKFGTGTSTPPDCASHDGIIPSPAYNNIQAKSCAACPHSKFGTAKSANGEKALGKACRNLKRIVILVQGESIPYLMTAPPGSIKPFEEYLITLRKDKRPYWSVATKFTIATETSKGGIKYPQARLEKAGFINDEAILDRLRMIREEWMSVVKQTQFSAAEVNETPTDTPPTEYVPPPGGEQY